MTSPAQYQGGNALSYVVGAQIKDSVQQAVGKIVTRPALLKSDGENLTYACDVVIEPTVGTVYEDYVLTGSGTVYGLYGQVPLRNVPIASANRQLTYAEVGSAVTLSRSSSGVFQITGFAKEMPGSYTRYSVNLSLNTTGSGVPSGLNTQVLTLLDLANPAFGGFGVVPLGAYGIYQGSTLIRLAY